MASEEYNKNVAFQEALEKEVKGMKAQIDLQLENEKEQMILEMNADDIPIKQIGKFTKKTEEEVLQVLEKHKKMDLNN